MNRQSVFQDNRCGGKFQRNSLITAQMLLHQKIHLTPSTIFLPKKTDASVWQKLFQENSV